MRVKILIWTKHPGDLLGEAIDFFTHGVAEHAGFLDSDGTVVEAYWPKLRRRPLLDAERQYVRAFVIRGVTEAQEAELSARMAQDLQHPPAYSGWDLLRFLFNVPTGDERSTFCSRYDQHTLESVLPQELWPLIRCQAGDWVSPRDLYVSNMLVPVDIDS